MSTKFSLKFEATIGEAARQRITYSFKLALLCGGLSWTDDSQQADIVCWYGNNPDACPDENLFIKARYNADLIDDPFAKNTDQVLIEGIEIPVFFGQDKGHCDHLAEIFFWASMCHEYRTDEFDSIGRISEQNNLFHRANIDPTLPYASIHARAFIQSLRSFSNQNKIEFECIDASSHWIIPSHDIDYYYTNVSSGFVRHFKNIAIAILVSKSPSFLFSNIFYLLKVLLPGKKPGKYLRPLADKLAELGVSSDFYFIVKNMHRRDANYRIEEIRSELRHINEKGHSVGTHGSYTSIIENNDLPSEYEVLRRQIPKAMGNRQHWLRFDKHEKLYKNVTTSKSKYDSTIGFSSRVGYRSGLDFAYPPYNFEIEAPHSFIEIPLVVMDTALAACKDNNEQWKTIKKLADQSSPDHLTSYSILWHNPLEATAVPKETNQLFWRAIKLYREQRAALVSGKDYLDHTYERYTAAGFKI